MGTGKAKNSNVLNEITLSVESANTKAIKANQKHESCVVKKCIVMMVRIYKFSKL